MKKLILIVWLLIISMGLLQAQDGYGGYAGSYARMGLGARSMALGNAGVADETNGFSFYYNPALTAFAKDKTFASAYNFLSLDRYLGFIGFSMQIPPSAGFSIGWLSSGVGDLRRYDSRGIDLGEMSQSANAFYFNFAIKFFEKLSFGLTIKYLWESISSDYADDPFDYSSSGLGWDFGAAYRLNEKLTFAASVRDIGSKLQANTSDIFQFGGTTIDRFPKFFTVGLRYTTPFNWLRVLYDFEIGEHDVNRHHAGLEAFYNDLLFLRFGMNDSYFTAGAGMGFKLYKYKSKLDYAFVPSVVDEGSSHVFSWQIHF